MSTSIFEKGLDFTLSPALGDEHLTAEMFFASLPESRDAFVPHYLDYNISTDNQGYQGRDIWKQMEKDVYKE